MADAEDSIRWIEIDGERRICTENLSKGVQVYGERLIKIHDTEYRVWDPFRSKLAAAIIKDLKTLPIKYGYKVLYLGASTGTTVSHVSDIVGTGGLVFAVESASRVARELIERVAVHRSNVIPIIEDARKPNAYFSVSGKVDVVYCDIAQPDQTEIAITNCRSYLKSKGYLILVVKPRSIDVTKDPKDVVREEVKKIQVSNFEVDQVINLHPFDKDHAMVLARYLP
ncbi:MAG TPA: fibrillarin-like rRNA/tRNA 2'-O-methyltransferase [Nitrososphaerales archaeon]|nr:fibrillarin-like rRNA/tRNA 2'-O-methyltransferase [Nitrososphaerales archaeon]